jgi:hypothetical protein
MHNCDFGDAGLLLCCLKCCGQQRMLGVGVGIHVRMMLRSSHLNFVSGCGSLLYLDCVESLDFDATAVTPGRKSHESSD